MHNIITNTQGNAEVLPIKFKRRASWMCYSKRFWMKIQKSSSIVRTKLRQDFKDKG